MAKTKQQDKRSNPLAVKQSGKASCPAKPHVRKATKGLAAKQYRACKSGARGKTTASGKSKDGSASMPTQKVLFADGYMFGANGQGEWKPEETGSEESRDLTPDYQDELQYYMNSLQDKKEEFSKDFDPWNAIVSNDRRTQERLPPDEIPARLAKRSSTR